MGTCLLPSLLDWRASLKLLQFQGSSLFGWGMMDGKDDRMDESEEQLQRSEMPLQAKPNGLEERKHALESIRRVVTAQS